MSRILSKVSSSTRGDGQYRDVRATSVDLRGAYTLEGMTDHSGERHNQERA